MATWGTGDWGTGVWGGVTTAIRVYANIARRKAKAAVLYLTRRR